MNAPYRQAPPPCEECADKDEELEELRERVVRLSDAFSSRWWREVKDYAFALTVIAVLAGVVLLIVRAVQPEVDATALPDGRPGAVIRCWSHMSHAGLQQCFAVEAGRACPHGYDVAVQPTEKEPGQEKSTDGYMVVVCKEPP